jgi:glucose-1-phosphate thymidylyltransferase
MRPHTHTAPKPLLEVAGKPILGHILEELKPLPVEEIIFVVGFKKEMIVDYIQSNWKYRTRFVEQDKPAGLGYAVNLTMPFVNSGPLLIVLGDTVVELDWEPIVASNENLLGLKEVSDPRRFGIAVLQNGKIVELEEKPAKPKGKSAIVGLYYIRDLSLFKTCLSELVSGAPGKNGEWQITDGLQKMIERGAAFRPLWIDRWFDCGKPETMLETNRHLLARLIETAQRPGSTILSPCFVAPTAEIESSVIGPNVSIGERASVKSSILRNCIVGAGARVSNSLLEDSLVGTGAVVSGRPGRVNVGDSSEVEVL